LLEQQSGGGAASTLLGRAFQQSHAVSSRVFLSNAKQLQAASTLGGVCSPELVQSKKPHRGSVPRCGSYSLWNRVAGKNGGIAEISTCPAPAVVMTAAAFDVFQWLLITNFDFLLCFWHIWPFFVFGLLFVVLTAVALINKETAPRN
jgi:hypothetical protein